MRKCFYLLFQLKFAFRLFRVLRFDIALTFCNLLFFKHKRLIKLIKLDNDDLIFFEYFNIFTEYNEKDIYGPEITDKDGALLDTHDSFYHTTKSLLVLFQIMGVMPIMRVPKGKNLVLVSSMIAKDYK